MQCFFLAFFAVVVVIAIIAFEIQNVQYKKTDYYQQTHLPYMNVRFDAGRFGEYLTYKYLQSLTGYKRFLFNLYIPKGKGETTEIDVLLLHESGIYVFESKNYSGWIFGTETQPYWTQTLPGKRKNVHKNHFYNPILQNKAHLKWLQTFLNENILPVFSYIVFSDRCTLKNITLTSTNHYVVNRYNLLSMIQQNAAKAGNKLSKDKIDQLFEKLYRLTQVDEAVKLAHIENIHKMMQRDNEQHFAIISVENPTEDTDICPRCGGKLVLRIASKGERKGKRFLGCSNYPKCKYIKNLSDEQ